MVYLPSDKLYRIQGQAVTVYPLASNITMVHCCNMKMMSCIYECFTVSSKL